MSAVKILVIPLLKRDWLFHAWSSGPAAKRTPFDWKEGATAVDKAKLLAEHIQSRVTGFVLSQWEQV